MKGFDLRGSDKSSMATAVQELLNNDGSWFIYRRYKLDQPANAVSITTGEGVGGERFQYVDEARLMRHDTTSIRTNVGFMTEKSAFYLAADSSPKRGDVIIRTLLEDRPAHTISQADVLLGQHVAVFRIEDVDIKRLESGKLAFFTCLASPEYEEY